MRDYFLHVGHEKSYESGSEGGSGSQRQHDEEGGPNRPTRSWPRGDRSRSP